MRACLLACAVSVVIQVALAADPTGGCHGVPHLQDPNPLPIQTYGPGISTLVSTVSNGKLYSVFVENEGGNNSYSYNLIHLYGTPYDWGFAQGTLLKTEASTFLTEVWAYLVQTVDNYIDKLPPWLQNMVANVGLDVALDLTYEASKHWTDPNIWDEMRGLADASGADYMMIVRVHQIAGLTKGDCSMFGAWGDALATGSGLPQLLQLRALDWDMSGPFRNYNQITVYHPINETYGHDFVMVGFTAFLGGLTGMSSTQLGISEIGVAYPDASFGAESRIGVPFIFVLRQILQYDYSLDDAISRLVNERRTCDLILGVGDGKISQFNGFEYSYSVLDVFNDENMRPTNSTWHPLIEDVVYWGMDWMCPSYNWLLSTQLNLYHGSLTPALAVMNVTAAEASGSNHVAFYDLTNMILYAAVATPPSAGGNPNAYTRQFTAFDVNALFAEEQ